MSERSPTPWECPRCDEQLPSQFDLCWQCGSDVNGEVSADFSPEVEHKEYDVCPSCSYDVHLGKIETCPECGYFLGEGHYVTVIHDSEIESAISRQRKFAFQRCLLVFGIGVVAFFMTSLAVEYAWWDVIFLFFYMFWIMFYLPLIIAAVTHFFHAFYGQANNTSSRCK